MAKLSEILRSGEGDALLWFCLGCQMAHQIMVGAGPGPRWRWNGNAELPTFYPSVLVQMGDPDRPGQDITRCHSFVVELPMQFLADCTHALAGQSIAIPSFHPDDEP